MNDKKRTPAKPLRIMKTYKIFIGGAFPRTESGRYDDLRDSKGALIANVCRSSRKDFRNAVVAARAAQPAWASRTAYNRSQIVYRIAEMLQPRETLFIEEMKSMGYTAAKAKSEFSQTVDYLIHYAGWVDKYVQVFGSVNPVASSHFNFSVPEPMGVIASVASPNKALLGIVSACIPAVCGGNTVVCLSSEKYPLCSISFAEVLANSDLPPGAINILTGRRSELIHQFASHMDVNALVIWDADSANSLEIGGYASENVKRTVYHDSEDIGSLSPRRILELQEIKTTWHPIERTFGKGSGY
jgi:acyl-CoA reductase-like NAD-dependent aldehyde dehydrogenase